MMINFLQNKLNMKSKLRDDYESACYNYIKEFERIYEFDFEGWIGDNVGGVALFGDYAIAFSDIIYIVDNDVHVDTFVNWYWFCAEYEQCKINLQNYFKLESDYKAEKIELGLKENDIMNDFKPYLIYLLLKKND